MARFIIIFFLFFGMIFVVGTRHVASLHFAVAADIEEDFPVNLDKTAVESGFIENQQNKKPTPEKLEQILGSSIGFLLSFTSLIFFFWLFYGAYKWLLAKGNDEKIQKAQKIIRAALWGILIIALSYIILNLILELLALGPESIQLYDISGNS